MSIRDNNFKNTMRKNYLYALSFVAMCLLLPALFSLWKSSAQPSISSAVLMASVFMLVMFAAFVYCILAVYRRGYHE